MPPPADEVEHLRAALVRAEAATRVAYQDTSRLIRLLTVIGTPSSPEELIDRTLVVLSEVYSADVACVADVTGETVVITNSVGLAEDDPALHQRFKLGPTALDALHTGRPVSRDNMRPEDVPPQLAHIGARVQAIIPLWDSEDPDRELLVLMRRSDEKLTPTDLQVLSSVGYRLHAAVEARERENAIEWLARAGPELSRHLDLPSIFREAVSLLRRHIGADSVWIVTIDGETAHLRAHAGLTDEFVKRWPRPVTELPGWGDRDSASLYSGPPEPHDLAPHQVMLSVPVERNGRTIALLCLATRSRLMHRTATEVTRILSSYLSVAMTNSELYQALASNEAELRRRATHDPLTGLANRVLATQRIEEALSRMPLPGVGLLFCDLDKFKDVNDRMGHEAGDELLQQVAGRLRRFTRPDDLLARFGGDEFVVVIDGVTDIRDLRYVGERVQTSLIDPFVLRGEPVRISASVGGVLGRHGRDTATAMLRDADAAMYEAKLKGPGRIEIFDEAASLRSMDRLDLRSAVATALDKGQFTVEYQPIVELATDRIIGFEALLRWDHPTRGAIPPNVFIPIAEETGAMVSIGAWVLEQSCEQLGRWKEIPAGSGLAIGVNMSATQLAEPGLASLALGAIDRAGISRDDLWLEITEHKRISEDVTAPVAQLREAGVHFALDDFGMSYSNLSYLRSFPVENIKVDKSFVSGIADSEADRGIVRAILAIGASLRLTVLAEGIETVAQRDALVALGCQYGQGFLLSRPLSVDEATDLIATGPEDGPTVHPLGRAHP